jgi:hypothetical protein
MGVSRKGTAGQKSCHANVTPLPPDWAQFEAILEVHGQDVKMMIVYLIGYLVRSPFSWQRYTCQVRACVCYTNERSLQVLDTLAEWLSHLFLFD